MGNDREARELTLGTPPPPPTRFQSEEGGDLGAAEEEWGIKLSVGGLILGGSVRLQTSVLINEWGSALWGGEEWDSGEDVLPEAQRPVAALPLPAAPALVISMNHEMKNRK